MKKMMMFILVFPLVLGLSGCKAKPFDSEEGYEFQQTNELVYTYNNGLFDQELFHYTFDSEMNVFVKDDSSVYNFTNINHYETVSDNIKALLNSFDDVTYNRVLFENFDSTIELSLGATEDDFNMTKVDLDGDTYQVTAFVAYEYGVNVVVSYHEIRFDDEIYYIPSYIQFFTVNIHKEVGYEYLDEKNEYDKDPVKVITYETIIVPIPPRTGADNPFNDLLEDDVTEVDYYTRVVAFEEEEVLCSDVVTSDCVEPGMTEIQVQIYDASFDDVLSFYESNYNAAYQNNVFTFRNLGYTFEMSDIDEVQVRDDNNDIVDVVNAVIRIYEGD